MGAPKYSESFHRNAESHFHKRSFFENVLWNLEADAITGVFAYVVGVAAKPNRQRMVAVSVREEPIKIDNPIARVGQNA